MIALAIVLALIVCCQLAAIWFGTHQLPRHPHRPLHFQGRRRLP